MKMPPDGGRLFPKERHDGLLFLKQAAFLLALIGLCLLVFGLVTGVSTVTLAPVPGSGNSETLCGPAFSPAKQGDTQPKGRILNEYGEWLCREKIGQSGNVSIAMVGTGVVALMAAGVVTITAVQRAKAQ